MAKPRKPKIPGRTYMKKSTGMPKVTQRVKQNYGQKYLRKMNKAIKLK